MAAKKRIQRSWLVVGVVVASAALLLAACQSKASDAPATKPPLAGGDDVPPPGTVAGACSAAGGLCSTGGRCNGDAAGLYPTDRDDLDHSCGKGSTGATCCLKCAVPDNPPTQCCGPSSSEIPLCINGAVGCHAGLRAIHAGETCGY